MPAPTPNLSSLPTTTPVATDNAGLGYANIVAIAAALVNTFGYEHFLTGEHGIQRGAILPANVGSATKAALFIKTTAGVDDLYMDVGTGWINLTNNATYGLNAAALTTHQTAATIDHPDGSITSGKYAAASILSAAIASGQITAAHFATAIQALVDGGDASALHSHPSTSGAQEFDINGNFTVPSGITKIWVTAIGAGGGGGGGIQSPFAYSGGGGGGGELYIKVPFIVTPGTIYAITVGASGAGGAAGNVGSKGGDTIFPHALRTLTAFGGYGGNPGTAGGGGAGGSRGGIPSEAGFNGSSVTGGNGGDSLMGSGGVGGTGAVGGAGIGNGSGGGGGAGILSGTPYAGGAGGAGFMLIEW